MRRKDTKKVNEDPKNGFVIDEEAGLQVPELPQSPEKMTLAAQIFEWFDVISTALIAVVLIFSLIFRVATIEGTSMENTLLGGEKVIITNLGYEPERGDIVVIYRENDKPIIKRVIGLPGETVDIHDGRVFVNNETVPLEEKYIQNMAITFAEAGGNYIDFPVTVPNGKVFVLGDNRLVSHDSRAADIGLVDQNNILGHAILRIFPFNKFGGLKQ